MHSRLNLGTYRAKWHGTFGLLNVQRKIYKLQTNQSDMVHLTYRAKRPVPSISKRSLQGTSRNQNRTGTPLTNYHFALSNQ